MIRIERNELIAERDSIRRLVIADFESQDGCIAFFVRGSMAKGTADAWSDIDATAVIAPEFYEEFLAKRLSAPARWGELLYNSGTSQPFLCISHFRPFVKLDLFYLRPEDLKPSCWCALPMEVSFDREGIVKDLIAKSSQLEVKFDPAQLNEAINQALSYAHEILRRVERGELVYARQILGSLRQSVVEIDACLHDRLPVGLSHFEHECQNVHVRDAVQSSYPTSHDRAAILASTKGLVELFRSQVVQLNERFSLRRDVAADMHLLDIVTTWPETALL